MVIYLEKMMERLNSGESKTIFRNIMCIVIIGLTKCGRTAWQEEGETRKCFQYCTDPSRQEFFISELFKVIQDAISLIFHYRTMFLFRTILSSTFINRIGCAINLESIMNSGLIPGGQFEQGKTDSIFLLVDLMNKEHKDLETIDLKAPRLARYLQTAWKKHQNTVCWVDIRFAQNVRLKFCQTRLDGIILYDTLPACCMPKAFKMETGEIIYEKVFASRQLLPKISFKDNWRKELGSEVVGHGESCQQTQTKTTNRTFFLWLRKHQWKNSAICL